MLTALPWRRSICARPHNRSLFETVHEPPPRGAPLMRALALSAMSRLPDGARLALERHRWLVLLLGFALLSLSIMCWRWGGTVADSIAYFDTARYLRGELPASALQAPFPYRILMPGLAALMPGDLRNAFAALNWLAVTGAAWTIALTVARLGLGRERAVWAGLMLIVSVPTFWYAPYLLVDPGSVLGRAVFVLAVVSGQPWLAAAAGILATAAREENILLLVWLVGMRQIALAPGVLALAVAGGWMLFVRWWLIPGLPSYLWRPSLDTLYAALADQRSLVSLLTGAGIVLPLALIGLRRPPTGARKLRSLLLLMALPPLYAALSVRIDGRVIWSLYPMLIPFAVAVGLKKDAPAA